MRRFLARQRSNATPAVAAASVLALPVLLALVLLHSGCTSGATTPLSVVQRQFLDANASAVGSNPRNPTELDWSVVADRIGDRRLVFLGEFTHGAKQVAAVRNDLIMYLHRNHDFSVILLEAGIGEQVIPNRDMDTLTPNEMTFGLFGAWRTDEMRDLMQYVKDNRLALAGYDVQRTGRSFERLFTGDPAGRIREFEGLYAEAESALRRRGVEYDSLREPTEALIAAYENEARTPDRSETAEARVARRTLTNRADFLKYMLEFVRDGDWNRRWAARDSVMAANVTWFAQEIFPEEKIIVVGHNFHVSYYNDLEEVMGEFLAPQLADETFVVGMFAGRGSYADNSGAPKQMAPPDSTHLDLKHVISYLRTRDSADSGTRSVAGAQTFFLPLPPRGVAGTDWLFKNIVINDTFVDLSGSNMVTLDRHFDAVLLLPHVTPPE